jgi:site-specific DNA recombinase
VPASELESLVVRRLAAFLASGSSVLDALGRSEDDAATREALAAAAQALSAELSKAPISMMRAFLLATVARVTLATEWLELTLSRQGLRGVLAEGSNLRFAPVRPDERNEEDLFHLRIEARLQRCGQEIRLVVEPDMASERPTRHDAALIKAIARGYIWYERLASGEVDSLRIIANELQVNQRYVGRILRSAFLAPDIVAAILEGRQPPQLSVEKLRFGAPLLWAEQRQLFGFSSTSLRTSHPARG